MKLPIVNKKWKAPTNVQEIFMFFQIVTNPNYELISLNCFSNAEELLKKIFLN
jgi:hypothetical protein